MSELPYYKRLVLAREYVRRSEMIQVDPTKKDRDTDNTLDEFTDVWNDYYAIYKVDEYGEHELVEDGADYDKVAFRYVNMLYDLYLETFDRSKGEPREFKEWLVFDLNDILDKTFEGRAQENKERSGHDH